MKKLEAIEMARGLAAVAVVAFHTNASASFAGLAMTDWAHPLRFGVDFFFVLSGFIIFHVHREDVGQPGKVRSYLLKRLIRLFPILWIVAGGWILLRAVLGHPTAPDAVGTSLLLYPSLTLPVPQVVWTLRHELLFYLVFALTVYSRRIGMAVFALWTGLALMQMGLILAGTPMEGTASMIFSPYVLDFVIGAIAAVLARKLQIRSWWPLLAGLALLAISCWLDVSILEDKDDAMNYVHPANLYLPVNGLIFGLIVLGLVAVEDKLRVPRWGVVLGAASYAIYLVHVIINSFTQGIAGWLGNGLGHLLIFAAGIIAGLVLHFVIEKPLTIALRARLLPRQPMPVVTR